LKTETPDFIAPDLFPPNSPDLNPVNYNVWSMKRCSNITPTTWMSWSIGWVLSGLNWIML